MKNFSIPASLIKAAATAFQPIRELLKLCMLRKPVTSISSNLSDRENRAGTENDKSNSDRDKIRSTPEFAGDYRTVRNGRVEKRTSHKPIRVTTSETMALPRIHTEQECSNNSWGTLMANFREKIYDFCFASNQFKPAMKLIVTDRAYNDREAFLAFHMGFKKSTHWPPNPLDQIIRMIRLLPQALVIADFGCGDGRLSMSVPNKVYSLDAVRTRPDIIKCNIANTPLKTDSIDIAVFCLSLMGTNLRIYMLEANRVLRLGGVIYIVEFSTIFEKLCDFKAGMESCGFKALEEDVHVKPFLFFQFKKVRDVSKNTDGFPFTLKPCARRSMEQNCLNLNKRY